MKKALSFVLVVGMLFALAGCGSNANDAAQAAQKIDVDLTKLSSTLVYAEVFNMLYSPEDYVGKTVKMNGAFSLYCQKMDENGKPDFDYPVYRSLCGGLSLAEMV